MNRKEIVITRTDDDSDRLMVYLGRITGLLLAVSLIAGANTYFYG